MIQLPKIIDAVDIFMNGDSAGIDKIACVMQDSADVPFEQEISNLELDKFACVIRNGEELLKKFPINTKDNTMMSVEAFLHTNENLPDEIVKTASYNLYKASEHWNLPEQKAKLQSFHNRPVSNFVNADKIDKKKYIVKTASADVKENPKIFALNAKYPIDTPELLKQAEFYFKRYGHRFDPIEKYEYSKNVIKQAEALSYHISTPGILKYANLTFEKNPHLKELLQARDKKANTDNAYTKLAKVVKDVDSLEKIAEAVAELDELMGLDKYYDKVIPDPIFTVFNSIEKVSERVGGKNISLESLKALPVETLQRLNLTNDAISELQSNDGLSVLESLPEPIKDEILAYL